MTSDGKRKLVKYMLFGGASLAVLYPIWVWFDAANLTLDSMVLFDVFPMFGLIAFSIMWLHIVGGAFREKLEKYFDFDKVVAVSSMLVLGSIILHPLIHFIALIVNRGVSIFGYVTNGKEYLIWIAVIAWLIFVGYDILKKFKNRNFFSKHWQVIRFTSTLGFFLILVHSLGIGRDLQTGFLRSVWLFYGVSAAVATIYTYGVRTILNRKRSS